MTNTPEPPIPSSLIDKLQKLRYIPEMEPRAALAENPKVYRAGYNLALEQAVDIVRLYQAEQTTPDSLLVDRLADKWAGDVEGNDLRVEFKADISSLQQGTPDRSSLIDSITAKVSGICIKAMLSKELDKSEIAKEIIRLEETDASDGDISDVTVAFQRLPRELAEALNYGMPMKADDWLAITNHLVTFLESRGMAIGFGYMSDAVKSLPQREAAQPVEWPQVAEAIRNAFAKSENVSADNYTVEQFNDLAEAAIGAVKRVHPEKLTMAHWWAMKPKLPAINLDELEPLGDAELADFKFHTMALLLKEDGGDSGLRLARILRRLFIAEKLNATKRESLKDQLDMLSDEDRATLFCKYCIHCGSRDARCTCEASD